MIIADTSGLLAFFDRTEPQHDAIRTIVVAGPEPLVVSPYVIAELDYLLATRVGVAEELSVLNELASGAYVLPVLEAGDLERIATIIDRYRDQAIGVADASIMVLADRYATKRILTLDHRHFDVLRQLSGGRFRLLP